MFFKKRVKKYCVTYMFKDGSNQGFGNIDCIWNGKTMENIRLCEKELVKIMIEDRKMIDPHVVILNLIEVDEERDG